jgi:hypothetical protein
MDIEKEPWQCHTTLHHCLANKIRSVADEPIHAKVHYFLICPGPVTVHTTYQLSCAEKTR